jgi:hypothetical protein
LVDLAIAPANTPASHDWRLPCVACSSTATLALLAGCNSGAKKPDEIITVNDYCAVMNDDPVDPAHVTVYKGQKVGFCCSQCLPKWQAMTDAQRDAALAAAVAKGKVKS